MFSEEGRANPGGPSGGGVRDMGVFFSSRRPRTVQIHPTFELGLRSPASAPTTGRPRCQAYFRQDPKHGEGGPRPFPPSGVPKVPSSANFSWHPQRLREEGRASLPVLIQTHLGYLTKRLATLWPSPVDT